MFSPWRNGDKKIRMFGGESEEEYRGGASGGGWRKWAEAYVEGLEIADERKGPKLYLLIKDGSEASRTLKDVTIKSLKVPNCVATSTAASTAPHLPLTRVPSVYTSSLNVFSWRSKK